MNPPTHHCSTLLQIWVKRIIVGIDGDVIEHELILSFAYLQSLLQNLSSPGSGDGSSEHVRSGVQISAKPPTDHVERFLFMLQLDVGENECLFLARCIITDKLLRFLPGGES